MKPYYDHGGITIYHGDWRKLDLPRYDLLLTDPPYGIGADKNLRANKQHGKALVASKDYGMGDWDNAPPSVCDLEKLHTLASWRILWGGNYFALPPSACWLVWDKDNGNNGYADCELAWSNMGGAVRRLKHRWMGMLQEDMKNKEHREHPTQKPIPVMIWSINQALSKCNKIASIIDPYMGSGTTLRAAKNLGIPCVGVEINERYCEIAAKRLSQEVMF